MKTKPLRHQTPVGAQRRYPVLLHVSVDFAASRGLILLYTLTVLPIVIWIMRDQFNSIPIELDEAAFVDGLSTWGAFVRIVLPHSVPGMAAAFILSLVLCWNEYFFAALLTSTDAKNPACHGGEPNWLARDQLVVNGGAGDGGHRPARYRWDISRTLYRQWFDLGRGKVARRSISFNIPSPHREVDARRVIAENGRVFIRG